MRKSLGSYAGFGRREVYYLAVEPARSMFQSRGERGVRLPGRSHGIITFVAAVRGTE